MSGQRHVDTGQNSAVSVHPRSKRSAILALLFPLMSRRLCAKRRRRLRRLCARAIRCVHGTVGCPRVAECRFDFFFSSLSERETCSSTSMTTSMPDARGIEPARDDGTNDANVRVRAQPSRGVIAPGIRSPGACSMRLVSTHVCV